jgi:hypothetical protein
MGNYCKGQSFGFLWLSIENYGFPQMTSIRSESYNFLTIEL